VTADGPRTAIEQQRLEALLRLDVVDVIDTTAEPALDDALGLVSMMVGAHAVAVSLVAFERAWTKATNGDRYEVAREASIAQLGIDAPDGFASMVVDADHALASHPAIAGLPLPVTCAAVAVRGPDGEPIGALEIVWADVRSLSAGTAMIMRRVADHAGYLIELRAEATEYRRFIELSPDPVTVLDVEGAIVMANPALASMLGYGSADALVGRTFLELVDRRDRSRVTSDLARVLFARSRTAQFDLQLRRLNGAAVSCSVSAGNLRGARRNVQLVIHDLSDRLRGEDERTRLSEQLARAQRLDAVGQIAGGLAHDLNNLLVVMVFNLSLAEESLDDAVRRVGAEPVRAVRQDLGELRLAVDRAGRLTSKLLEFAQRHDSDSEVASIADAIETVQGLIARSLGAGVSLVLDLDEGLPPVAADPIKLERALVNLVINARDAMDEGGTIRIVGRIATIVPSGKARPSGASTGPSALIVEVIDDGCGMEQSVQARAFEPLFTTKGEGGSGLGLATVAAFADEYDGSVYVDSVPGRGTRVSITLPVADHVVDQLPIGMDVPVGGARVLLVDPGERTRRVIARMLQGAGYRVRAVGSAEDAIAALEEMPHDLLVTELSLPGMTGVRLLAELGERQPELRTVALASVDAPPALDRTPVLVKPFSHTRLLRTVERVMQGR
jgi:two-component system, cell cycle sensor histidine kinase and response regulator CckA